MLPDFPQGKILLRKKINLLFKQAIHAESFVMSHLAGFFQHEGNKCTYETEDGEIKEMKYERMESTITINLDEVPDLGPSVIKKRITTAAKEMASQQMGMFFTTLEDLTKEVGNAVDARGMPFSPELIHEMLRKIQIDFNDDGKPYLPTIIVGPEVAKQLEGKFKEWERNPKFKKEFDEIINIKREEWRDRESNRKLVD